MTGYQDRYRELGNSGRNRVLSASCYRISSGLYPTDVVVLMAFVLSAAALLSLPWWLP